MSFRLAKQLLSQYTAIHSICKSIELVTILTLQMYKKKISSSRKLVKLLFCYVKEVYTYNYQSYKHLIVPYLTDKSCSGIVNNYLWTNVKEMLQLLSYKNIIVKIFGTSSRFQKNMMLHSSNRNVIGNLYRLSNETVTYYTSYLLLSEFIFLEQNYFLFFFNEYVNIYNQVINYYLIHSLSSFINLFFLNEFSFYLNSLLNFIDVYFFFTSVILLDLIEANMYSELGSRANSMTNSIQSSKENVKLYTLVFNRFRQAKITNEIIEIISSSNI